MITVSNQFQREEMSERRRAKELALGVGRGVLIKRIVQLSVCIPIVVLIAGLLEVTETSFAYVSPVFIPAPSRTDMVHDLKRNMLYIASGDQVLRYDMSTNSFATPWVLGGNLKGIDISQDDNTLAVADLSSTVTQVWVHLVNVEDGTSQQLLMDRNFMEAGTYAVAFGRDGKIYSTSDTAGSGWQLFRQIDPQTRTAVNLLTISDQTMVSASSNGEIIAFAEGNNSSGSFGTYNVTSGALEHRTGYDHGTGWFNYEIVANHDGTQFAIPTYGGTFILDQGLNKIKTLGIYASEYADGVAYNPMTNDLYLSLVDTTLVRAYDSNTFEPVAEYDFGETFGANHNWSFYEGRLKTSKDGNILFALVNGGVKYLVLDLVLRNPTTTTIESSLNPSVHGEMVTFTAMVSSSDGTPTGSVTFMDGATTLSKGTLSGGPATATFSISSLSVGTHSIRAAYGGDTDFASSSSAILAQTILKPDSPWLMVPSEYPTIQEAISTAATGDTILVAPGSYKENLDFMGKPIIVKSEAGPNLTFIDGNHLGPVVTFASGEGSTSILSGFTIQNGYGDWGAGITINSSSPTIVGNILDGNAQGAGGFGAAIGGNGSSPLIEQNYFHNNTCDSQWLSGVVSFVNNSSPIIVNNVFENNQCTAINMTLPQSNHPIITNNTIVGNRLGIRVDRRGDASLQDYRNNIIVGNGSGLHVDFGSETYNPTWRNNIVFNNGVDYDGIGNQTGRNGNISADPLFVDPVNGNYHLRFGSAAIDSGDNKAPYLPATDFDGDPRISDGNRDRRAVVDMGADEYVGYTVKGRIITSGGIPLQGVTVKLSSATSVTTTTNLDGRYVFKNVANGTYTVTPSKTGYTFEPTNKIVTVDRANVIGQDFTTAPTGGGSYSISGKVTSGTGALSGVAMTLGGAANEVTTTDSEGNYTFTGLANGTYTVTPSKKGFTFLPKSRKATIYNADVKGRNFAGTGM